MDKSAELYMKYSRKQAEMAANIARLEAELSAARDRENLIKGMLADMESLQGNRSARSAAVASIPETNTPVIATPVERPKGPGRGKGRATAAAPRAFEMASGDTNLANNSSDADAEGVEDVGALSIVDAAIQLAQAKGVKEAKASDVHGWFEEAGYERRNGVPNRNSIYVSLNREANQTEDSPTPRIRKERRGVFRFL